MEKRPRTLRGLIVILLCYSIGGFGQYKIHPVFPDLDGSILFDSLRAQFTPETVLSLAQARDTLYKKIYLEDDSVRCVYSGLSRHLDSEADPSQYLFDNGGNSGINLEHSWPRSKGADRGRPLSDMHHLFPTRVPVNAARGSDPFRDIEDDMTQTWYYQDLTLTAPPGNNRNLYAEDTDVLFEPREDFKGNAARALFYFYTIYREDAVNADPQFFEAQRHTLCAWHDNDPVDSLEWTRTFRIGVYQQNKVNPFILDCRLARLYCDEINPGCLLVHTVREPEPFKGDLFVIYPNPTSGKVHLILNSELREPVAIQAFNMYGQMIHNVRQHWPFKSEYAIRIDNAVSDIVFIRVSTSRGSVTRKLALF